jgi:uncharacterized membrane protein
MLNHPHILKVIDSGLYETRPYIISEYARGGTLREYINRSNGQPLPGEEAIKILRQVGLGLQYAQNKGLIHRDIKPENILFDDNGDALLADFNISVVSTATSSVKNVDATGTPPYMAPEQFNNMVCKESDQYALGVIAYELFTGRRPFYGIDFIALANAHSSQLPLSLRQINPALPEYIDLAVLKALEKKREDRFSTIDAFIGALQLGATIPASPAPMPESSETITTSFFCYSLLLASGLTVLLFKENQRRFVRFHAWQSTLFSATATILLLLFVPLTLATPPTMLLNFVFVIGADSILGFLTLTGWFVLMYNAWKGLYFKLPLFGTFADRLATGKPLYNVQQITTVPGTTNLATITENDKFMAMMSYSFFWVTGLITFFLGKKKRFIRFHALQSIFFFCIVMLACLIILPLKNLELPLLQEITIAIVIYSVLFTFLIAGWGWGMYHAFKGHYYKMPFIGDYVENIIKQDTSLV